MFDTAVQHLAALAARAHEPHRSMYFYSKNPTKPIAILTTILYGLVLVGHSAQLVYYRTWYFTVVLVACIMEVIGYLTRILSADNVTNKGLFICQFALVVLAPVLIAAGDYIVFGRLLRGILPAHGKPARSLGVPARAVIWIFLSGDIISFVLQGIGAGIMSAASDGTNLDKLRLGQNVMIGGLCVQLLFFGFFSLATVRFDMKTRKMADFGHGATGRPKWRWMLWGMYFSELLILMRSAYRVAEFSQGWTGFLASHEVYFYGFEALLMLIALGIFNVVHPGLFGPSNEQIRNAEAEQQARLSEKPEGQDW